MRRAGLLPLFALAVFSHVAVAQQTPRALSCAEPHSQDAVDYYISLRRAPDHLLHVVVRSRGVLYQLPVWNALYQVRDFAKNVNRVSATEGEQDLPTTVTKIDKTTWRLASRTGCTRLEYDVFVDTPPPFGADADGNHAFLNLALLLMYSVDSRKLPVSVRFADVPAGWHVASSLTAQAQDTTLHADNYDALADAPVEISDFATIAGTGKYGANYRIAVHANRADYDPKQLNDAVGRIVASGIDWMNDRPFDDYLFIFHFPRGPAGGGMEHAYSTAISVSTDRLHEAIAAFAGTTSHEFFHLWNVKRIRPQTLEPIDYTREQYTRALWFSEGVTTTVGESLLVRAGLLDERGYLDWLASEIETLEARPARLTQSAEESSLDTWFDKYPSYAQSERSISYYNKGAILGALLDLEMRRATNRRKCLRDLFQYMNANYAKRGSFFDDSEGVRESAEAVTGANLAPFFAKYVAGVEELPYDDLLSYVGLHLQHTNRQVAMAGFTAERKFELYPVVTSVMPGSEAQRAGLAVGDFIVSLNDVPAGPTPDRQIADLNAGDTLKLKIRRGKHEHEIKLKLETQSRESWRIVEREDVTDAQRARREAWIRAEAEPGEPK